VGKRLLVTVDKRAAIRLAIIMRVKLQLQRCSHCFRSYDRTAESFR